MTDTALVTVGLLMIVMTGGFCIGQSIRALRETEWLRGVLLGLVGMALVMVLVQTLP